MGSSSEYGHTLFWNWLKSAKYLHILICITKCLFIGFLALFRATKVFQRATLENYCYTICPKGSFWFHYSLPLLPQKTMMIKITMMMNSLFQLKRDTFLLLCHLCHHQCGGGIKWIPMPKPSMPLSMSWNVTTSCADGYYSLIRKKIQTTIPKGLANPIFMYH